MRRNELTLTLRTRRTAALFVDKTAGNSYRFEFRQALLRKVQKINYLGGPLPPCTLRVFPRSLKWKNAVCTRWAGARQSIAAVWPRPCARESEAGATSPRRVLLIPRANPAPVKRSVGRVARNKRGPKSGRQMGPQVQERHAAAPQLKRPAPFKCFICL
jgi:hypothetical protein